MDFEKYTSTSMVISTRELEILNLLSEGLSSKEIADQLYISYDTVRTHRNNILKKTKFKTLTQAVSYCIRDGII
ncbi:response regulator transcription factor [Eudoraea adriatica]|uniref:response regulator transcription factor n=1 Tax=Eudoraea adriatica TaxID=446681 RepID=UPI0009FEC7B9